MNSWKLKCKRWRDKNSQKIINPRRNTSSKLPHYVIKEISKNNRVNITLHVPKRFSFIDNTEETMDFIERFMTLIECSEPCTQFHVESVNVEYVTVDALIYLLAVMDNLKLYKKYSYSGSFPKNDEVKKVYIDSGFTQYVKTHNDLNSKLPKSNEKMLIKRGIHNDSDIAVELCDFVCRSLNLKQKNSTLELYKILIELFSNAYWHAYNPNEIIKGKWYVYAEHINDFVRIVFADTGKGIPDTVRRKLSEKIFMFINNIFAVGKGVSDSKLIKSALNGEFRTQTQETFRGNGLNTVREQALKDSFLRFDIISGHGRCFLCKDNIAKEFNDGDIYSIEYKHKIYGTLYVFDFCRRNSDE